MAHYDVFREQLALKYRALGHALWEPSPTNPDRPVLVGDVGFIRAGRFHSLFNALRPPDQSDYLGVPEYYEPLIPSYQNHIVTGTLYPNNYCSDGVNIEQVPIYDSSGSV